MLRNSEDQDRIALLVFGLLLSVCTVAVVGFIVFAQFGTGSALIAAALMTIVVALVVLSLDRAIHS